MVFCEHPAAIVALLENRDSHPSLAAGWALRRVRNLLDRSRRRGGEPIPPRRLRARTGAPGAAQFTEGGAEAAEELLAALAAAGRSIDAVTSLLDFGCGSGRVLPHLARRARGARATGCDVDAAAITWAARHRPGLDWLLSGARPPLPLAGGAIDVLYSISVFSHLSEERQDEWLDELARVITPGGIALLSVHGPHAFEQFRTGAVRSRWCRPGAFERPPLAPGEFVFEPYLRTRWNAAELPGVGERYGLAFHGAEYVREHWARAFDVLEVRRRAISGWQDLVVLAPRA